MKGGSAAGGGRPAKTAVVVAVQAALALLSQAPARAALQLPGQTPSAPIELHVRGGGDQWRSTNKFALDWRNPTQPSIAAVHYRVRDAAGAGILGEARAEWPLESIPELLVPHGAGPYTAEVWLEGPMNSQGRPATVELRFDDTRPGFSQPVERSGWIGRAEFPYALRLLHPTGQAPPSGIHGYAVSVDTEPGSSPCASSSVCSDAETDLRGGVGDDVLSLKEMPEGTFYVHAVAVSGSGMHSSAVGHSTIRVDKTDPLTRISGIPEGWVDHSVSLAATATDSGSGMDPGNGGSPFTAIRVDGSAPTIAESPSVATTVIESGVHSIEFYARDAAGNVDDGEKSNGLPNRPPSTARVRIDRDPPGVAFAAAQDPADPEAIEASVSDALSGPDPSRGQIAVRQFGSGDRYEPLPTRSDSQGLRAHWDSESSPPGLYEFRATAYDLAGNGASSGRRAGGSSMVLANPLKSPTTLSAGFGGPVLVWHRCARRGERRRCRLERVAEFDQRPAERAMPFGHGTLFSGQLMNASRAALPGRPVSVVERFAAGGPVAERSTEVLTDDEGRFTVRLPPGPSREVFAVFDGGRTLTRAVSRSSQLEVLSGVRLRASSATARVGGAPVVFSGEVSGAGSPMPPDGLWVELQFRLPGLPWSEFRTVQTDPRGRFRYRYGFADNDSRGMRFQFRAFVPAPQGDWPYEPGSSRPVAVRGR
jgi:hypothetical protein